MTLQTVEWIEAAKETFDIAADKGDYETCKMVIADMYDKGYEKNAQELNNILGSLPLSKFAVESPIIL